MALFPGILFAQSPFDGTWKTNFFESKLSQKPYEFWFNKGMYDCNSCVPKIHIPADGKDQPVTGQTHDTLSVQVVDPNTLHFIAKKADKTEFESTRTVSPDGKTLTVSSTNYPPDGSVSPSRNSAASPKGPRAPTLPPVRGASATSILGANALISSWKGRDNGISLSTPTGYNWEAKFDGKEYPVKGTYANETVSAKKLNDQAIELTFKRDGKVESTEKLTVSPDGKKMTSVFDNKLTGRVSTYIDEKQ